VEKEILNARRGIKFQQREEQKRAENVRINNKIIEQETSGQGGSPN
jgi:hypothetical protein